VGADLKSVPVILRQRSRFWHFNAHAILCEGEAAVVDPGIFPDELDRFAQTIAARGARVREVILTHSHHDHIRGWQRFQGARVVVPKRLQEKDATARARILAAKAAVDAKFGVDDPGFSYPEPGLAFDEETTLYVGGSEVLLRMNPGHSDCSSVVIVPAARALFSGDYLVSPGMPYCRWRVDRHVGALENVARWAEEFAVETACPAHNDPIQGKAAIGEALRLEKEYFDCLRQIVAELFQQKLPEEELIKETARRIRPGKLWEQDRDNARRALRELRGA